MIGTRSSSVVRPSSRIAVWWVRRDMRLADNQALAAAVLGQLDETGELKNIYRQDGQTLKIFVVNNNLTVIMKRLTAATVVLAGIAAAGLAGRAGLWDRLRHGAANRSATARLLSWPGRHSLADDPDFFNAPDGNTDAEAELEATLAAFCNAVRTTLAGSITPSLIMSP